MFRLILQSFDAFGQAIVGGLKQSIESIGNSSNTQLSTYFKDTKDIFSSSFSPVVPVKPALLVRQEKFIKCGPS